MRPSPTCIQPITQSHLRLSPRRSRRLAKHGVEVVPLEESVSVHGMPVCRNLARPLPVAERVRRHTEVFGGIRDAQKLPQLGQLGDSQIVGRVGSTLPTSLGITRKMQGASRAATCPQADSTTQPTKGTPSAEVVRAGRHESVEFATRSKTGRGLVLRSVRGCVPQESRFIATDNLYLLA